MADVYAGERDDGAFEQRVAIKILRRGLDTEDLLARFRRERSILARLEHPAIARVVDGGALADGRPYLVMERVDGQPIHLFAAERALSIEDRLRLLLVAGDAVAYAHRNLVVHRDLKPSNVLVSASGELKLLDFGIATILAPDGSPRQTLRETRVLTPAYAAPEQLAAEPTTTATDVWGLGALAFELLAHEPPSSRRRGLDAAEAAVAYSRDFDLTPRLSTRALEVGGATAAALRWARRLRGDLDTIVGKALAREPERRYPSAEAFADDLRRHLDGRPVLARADALGYRVGKFVRRHRIVVSASAAGALSLAAGATVALWQAHRARRERDGAERARQRSESLVDFMLGDLQERLEPSNRLDVVADLARAVEESLDAIPDAERTSVSIAQRARVLMQLANTLNLQGHPKQAEAELRRAIELLTRLVSESPAPPEIATRLASARTLLVRLLADGGHSRDAADAARAAVRGWRSLVAARPEDPEARVGLVGALNEAGRALLVSEDALEARQGHLEAIELLETLPAHVLARREVAMQRYNAHEYAGRSFEFAGDFEAAIEQYGVGIEQASAYSAANPTDVAARYEIGTITNDLGRTLRKMGRLAEAIAAFERALAITEEVAERDPGNHYFRSDLAACHGFLGRVHEVGGNLDAALDEFRADVAINEQLVAIEPENGSWNGFYAGALTKEGRVLMELGRLEEAAARHQQALALRQRALEIVGQDAMAQGDVAESLLELGRVEARRGLGEAARSAWRQAAELLEVALRTSDFVVAADALRAHAPRAGRHRASATGGRASAVRALQRAGAARALRAARHRDLSEVSRPSGSVQALQRRLIASPRVKSQP